MVDVATGSSNSARRWKLDHAHQRVVQRVARGVVGTVGGLRGGLSFSMYSVEMAGRTKMKSLWK
jgi:hypothetical protein